ncbi:MAG TPA: hypothetical protein VGB79_01705 [Allosphingosinicella sp.]
MTGPTSPKYLSLTFPLTYQVHTSAADKVGDAAISFKIQYRNITTSGAWTDLTATIPGGVAQVLSNGTSYDGSINYSTTWSGSVAGQTYEFQLLAWRAGGATMGDVFYVKSGTLTVQWAP